MSAYRPSLLDRLRLPALLLATSLLGIVPPLAAQIEVVNTYTASTKRSPDIARLQDGSFIVVWESEGQDGDDTGIFARRVSSEGVPTGAEIAIPTTTADSQKDPTLATLADGRFVVVWHSSFQPRARVFESNGSPVDSEIELGSQSIRRPTVAADDTGGFAVTWRDPADDEIRFQRYDSVGMPLGLESVLGPSQDEARPDLRHWGDGEFLVVWEHRSPQDPSIRGIAGRFADSTGSPPSSRFFVSQTQSQIHEYPVIARAPSGEGVVLWGKGNYTPRNVVGRFLDPSGTPVGSEIVVNSVDQEFQAVPAIATTSDGYLAVWYENSFLREDILGRRFEAAGSPVGSEFFAAGTLDLSMTLAFNYGRPAVAASAEDLPVTVWAYLEQVLVRKRSPFILLPANVLLCENASGDVQIGTEGGTDPIDLAVPTIPGATFDINPVNPGGTSLLTLPASVSQTPFIEFLVTGDDGQSIYDLPLRLEVLPVPIPAPVLLGPPNGGTGVEATPVYRWRIPDLEGFGYDHTPWVHFLLEISTDAAFMEIVQTFNGQPDHDYHSVSGQPLQLGTEYFWRVTHQTPCGDSQSEGSFTTSADRVIHQDTPGDPLEGRPQIAAASAHGEFVVAFQSNRDLYDTGPYYLVLNRYAIVGQADEAPIRDTFGTNFYDTDPPPFQAVGSGKEDQFIIVWTDHFDHYYFDGAQEREAQPVGLFDMARRSSDGPEDGELVGVRTIREIVGGNAQNVFAQRLTADLSTRLGDEFRVNQWLVGDQTRPTVAFLEGSGTFLVAWESEYDPGDRPPWNVGNNIRGRVFEPNGMAIGEEFQVNSLSDGIQRDPKVTSNPAGDGFLVVWRSSASNGTDTSGWSIQGRLVDPTTGPQGSDFQINSQTPLDQWTPSIAMEPESGRFLVTWRSGSSSGSDPGWSIQARRLTADGVPLAEDFQVNVATSGQQFAPDVAANDATGEFMVVWRDEDNVTVRRLPAESPLVFADGFESGDTSGWQ